MIYIIMILVSLFFTYLAKHSYKGRYRNLLCVLAFLPPVLVAAFRYNNGADYLMYLNMFKVFQLPGSTTSSFTNVKTIEIGFFGLAKLLGYFCGDNYWVIFGVIALIVCGFIYVGIWQQSKDILLSVYLFFAAGIYFDSYNALRQFIAIPIIFYATKYLYDGNFKKYLIFVLIATLFHYSAVIMIPVYFIRNVNIDFKRMIIIALFCVVGVSIIYNIATYLLQYTRFSIYLKSIEYQIIPDEAAILYLSIISVVTYGYKALFMKNVSQKTQIMFNYQIIVLCAALLSLSVPLMRRVQEYLFVFELIFIPQFLFEVKNKTHKKLLKLMFIGLYTSIVLYGILVKDWYTILPYNFYFNYM